MERSGNKILLTLAPNKLGTYDLIVPISLKKPLLEDGYVTYKLPSLTNSFRVGSGKLTFLNMSKQEVTPKDNSKEPIEIQIENNYLLKIGKTYRLEDQEEKGGALVGELFTKTRLNNNKVLCLFRPYAFHRKSEGYLYIKDGDKPVFVTSVDITPKTRIDNIQILREGKDWVASNIIYPGESVRIKFEGDGLHKGQFIFSGIDYSQTDSLVRNEKFIFYDIKIPRDIQSNKIEIFNYSETTGKYLRVNEHNKPRPFDYVNLKLGEKKSYNVERIERPIYFEENLSDLVISFDRSKIDGNDFFGPQQLEIDVKISNKQGNLIEIYNFEDITICPDESSLRSGSYESLGCLSGNINLNNYLSRKTYNLDEWSRIELVISHKAGKYSRPQKKKIQIYLKRDFNFDIDVSFPGGLLILKAKEREFKNFSGVSFAMIGQFSFYQKGKIAKYQPYKLGAGFIAVDAFNFSSNAANRDVGLVIIGSVYPTSKNPNRKLTLPLYAGFGYLMKDQKLFSLIGPGIRVRL